MSFPLKIRYNRFFLIAQFSIGFWLLGLAIYTIDYSQIILACILLLIGIKNIRTPILEVTPTEIILRNGLGLTANTYAYLGKDLEIQDNLILLDKKKIYKHSFMFMDSDFEEVRAFLAGENPEGNLKRHLIEDIE